MRAAAAAVAALALLAVPAASAADATPAELRELAARAASDEAALVELRELDRVDGVPVDLEAALAGAEGEELEARLVALAEGAAAAPGAAPAEARQEAADILAERRFHETGPPRPFDRLLAWLGDRLEPLARPFRWLAGRLPGGESLLWALLGALVIAAAAAFAVWLGRRRGGTIAERLARGRAEPALDPRELDRMAERAEERGELDLALRLRFRAGLVRLARLRAVRQPETMTNRQLVRLLHSDQFAGLANTLDEVVYGGRAASPADLEAAKSGWPRVLAGASP
jgi:Domain of unknown function (DUF4129)